MRKISIFIQWLVVIAICAFLVYVIMRPTPQPDYNPETWRNWSGITVLSYPGITRKETPVYPSVKVLESHLSALRDAGYQTVQPEDVRAYLDQHAPLPDKALLLIFEGGRKEAFIRATPVLQRTGYSAVLTVPTVVMKQWGNFYLKKKDVRKIDNLPQWQVGSMGHKAITPIPGSAPENERRYLTQRFKDKREAESPETFRERIMQDYALSARLLNEAIGMPAQLYLYPYSDAGQSPSADPLAETVNREAVTRYYSLAFIGSASAFNGPGTDPWALTRLRVPGNWTAEQLLAELESSKPRTKPLETIGTAENWVLERDAELGDQEFYLIPDSAAWLRGTENWTDVDISATLHPGKEGIGSLYARYSSMRSWLRVTADAQSISVQERLGNRLITLFRQSLKEKGADGYKVRIRLRNNRAWLWLQDKPLAKKLPLSPGTERGRTGLGAQGSEVRVSAFSAKPLPARWVLGNSIRLINDADLEQVQAIVPNWFRAGEKPNLSQTAKQDLMRASVAGINTYPLLTGGGTLSEEKMRNWAEAIDEELSRNELKVLTSGIAVAGPHFPLTDELRNRNYKVVHMLSLQEALVWGRVIAEESEDEIIIVNDHSPDADEAIHTLLRTIPSTRLVQLEKDETAIAPDIKTMRMLEPPMDH